VIVHDDTLPLFPPPPRVPPPGGIEPALAVATSASSRPFHLEGTRTRVHGSEFDGVSTVVIDGVTVASLLRAGRGTGANVLVSPGRIRREHIGHRGSSMETVLVAPSLPLVAAHWTAPPSLQAAAHGQDPEEGLSLTVFPESTSVRYHAAGLLVSIACGDDPRILSLAWVPETDGMDSAAEPGSWTVGTLDGRAVATRTGPRGGTLLIAFGPSAAIRTALQGAAYLDAHERRSCGEGDPDTLLLTTGSPDLDDAVAWMALRLRSGILQADEARRGVAGRAPLAATPADASAAAAAGVAWLWAGLGAAAIGDEDAAMRCVSALEVSDLEAAALLAAQVALTSGRTDVALGLAGRLQADHVSTDPDLAGLARERLADALRYALPEETLAALRAGPGRGEGATGRGPSPDLGTTPSPAAPPPGSATPARRGGLKLPMAGSGPPPVGRGSPARPSAAWLRLVLTGPRFPFQPAGTPPPTPPDPAEARALLVWDGLAAGDPEAWEGWRAAVAEGWAGTRIGAAAWDPLNRPTPPAVTGLLMAGMVHGWLGVSPDAPMGRLRLAPLLPARIQGFAVRGVPVGDARAGLSFRRDGAEHGFRLEPEHGRVPPYVVFETRIAGRVERVWIDDQPADPEMIEGAQGTVVRLQTPLDAPRTIRIERASTSPPTRD